MARSSIMSHSNHRTTPPNNYYKPAPAEISYGHMRFLITDRPSDATMGQFLEELKRHQVHIVVRVCEPTYSVEELKQHGIEVVVGY
ncbi:Protein tyrosine phosphatase type IVA 3 [Trichinella pseudospiralis]|uniref:Protein tyrosine phosphatase type IVA 3 n=1 Tax=Trichinella pseudospiralis TaxID=6337 RepID=A0A0V0XYR6_TRIPS|nr:Protein tyrosine phosphatase type IVA 3 [Trichinella pseudospiralis]